MLLAVAVFLFGRHRFRAYNAGVIESVFKKSGEINVLNVVRVKKMFAAGLCAFVFTAGCLRAENPPTSYTEPLSSTLESWPYPFPVRYLPVTFENQDLRMAYMYAQTQQATLRGTVILLHGKNFDGSYFTNTVNALNAAGYNVLIPDQIGFGRSSKPDIPYSFDLLAGYTLQLMDNLKIDRAAVVGHSTGGMLAVRLARQAPDRITRLILENPVGLEDYRTFFSPVSTDIWYQQELKNTDPDKIRAFLKRYFVTWRPEYEAFVEKRARIALSGEYPRFCKASALTYQMICQQPVVYEFPLIQQPTLLAIGSHDRTAIGKDKVSSEVAARMGNYPELAKAAAKAIPRATLKIFDQSGHIPHLEQPEDYHRELLAFLE